jgi:transposase
MPEPVVTTHVVGIDIGMESCTMSCLTMDKRPVIKSNPFANTVQGFGWLFERLEGLGVAPKQMLVGLEATSRYGENLLQALLKRGYQVCLLHPAQMHAFAQQRGLRAKTDQLDAVTIERALPLWQTRALQSAFVHLLLPAPGEAELESHCRALLRTKHARTAVSGSPVGLAHVLWPDR